MAVLHERPVAPPQITQAFRPVLLLAPGAPVRANLRHELASHGLDTRATRPDAIRTDHKGHDIALLDLPWMNNSGFRALHEIRLTAPQLPVIVRARAQQVEDRIRSLDAGAIDYVDAATPVAELAARIRAHLYWLETTRPTRICEAGIELDLITHHVTHHGVPVRLSTTEFRLLAHLVRNPAVTLTRTEILQAVWGYQHDPGTNVVDVYIGYLRRKLGGRNAPIKTVRAIGYALQPTTA